MVNLLDRGPETVVVFPEEVITDSYGNKVRRPAATGVTVTGCHMQPSAGGGDSGSAISVQAGQEAKAHWRLIMRDAPVGFWSRVTWRGRSFTVLGGPIVRRYSESTSHITVTLAEER